MFKQPLAIARYRLIWQIDQPIHLPDYAGSTLRGAFGVALRYISCMTKEPTCHACPLIHTCPYSRIFESPAVGKHELQKFSHLPNPYVIEPPKWGSCSYQTGDFLSFDMVLIGQAIENLPLIIFAWQKAFTRGIAKGDGTAKLIAVEHIEQDNQANTIYAPEHGIEKLLDHQNTITLTDKFALDSLDLSLTFETPLRLQENGKVVQAQNLDAHRLLIGLARRVNLILEIHGLDPETAHQTNFTQLSELARQIQIDTSQLSWRDWSRYSNRQQQKMALGGYVGKLSLYGNVSPFMPFLYLGQWLHVGKNATFGLGKYVL